MIVAGEFPGLANFYDRYHFDTGWRVAKKADFPRVKLGRFLLAIFSDYRGVGNWHYLSGSWMFRGIIPFGLGFNRLGTFFPKAQVFHFFSTPKNFPQRVGRNFYLFRDFSTRVREGIFEKGSSKGTEIGGDSSFLLGPYSWTLQGCRGFLDPCVSDSRFETLSFLSLPLFPQFLTLQRAFFARIPNRGWAPTSFSRFLPPFFL